MCFVGYEPDFSAVYRKKITRDYCRASPNPFVLHYPVVLINHIPEALRQIHVRQRSRLVE